MVSFISSVSFFFCSKTSYLPTGAILICLVFIATGWPAVWPAPGLNCPVLSADTQNVQETWHGYGSGRPNAAANPQGMAYKQVRVCHGYGRNHNRRRTHYTRMYTVVQWLAGNTEHMRDGGSA